MRSNNVYNVTLELFNRGGSFAYMIGYMALGLQAMTVSAEFYPKPRV